MKSYIFSSESVTKGHPDKVCDIISDTVLDAYLRVDSFARVAVETLIKNNTVVLAGEVTSKAHNINIESLVRNVINSIGYNKEELGFNGNTAKIITLLDKQSVDIARGVNHAFESKTNDEEDCIGAGDQGMVFGYACSDTPVLMPLPVFLSHALARKLTEVRENGELPYLRPDGKTQVSVKYIDDKAVSVDTVIVSAQHDSEISQSQISSDILNRVIKTVIPPNLLSGKTNILINPTGRFVIGGPVGDSGLTGRKIIVDTYGGAARHGGGAFSGKDSTKVDRSAAYAARYAAKNIVAAGLAERAEIQIAYAIGVAKPVSINVNTYGTGKMSDNDLCELISSVVDFRPGAIIRKFDLRNPIYSKTAAYGHFGRLDYEFPWEKTDIAEILKNNKAAH